MVTLRPQLPQRQVESSSAIPLLGLTFGPTGYCNSRTSHCGHKCTTAGCDCTSDPEHACGEGLKPVIDPSCDKCTCQPIHNGSQRARARRNVRLVESLCPKSFSACTIGGSKGFECVDTQTSLEQCGGCLESGEGVDCTTIPNVSAVGCVAGVCKSSSLSAFLA